MKWFKHHCNAHDNKKLIPLLRQTGVEGYGRYWLLCEFIGAHISGKSGHIVRMLPEDWAKILRTKREQCRNFLNICSEVGVLTFDHSGNEWTIEMPKLLEIRDEYSRKSGHPTDKEPTNSGQTPDLIDKRKRKKRERADSGRVNPIVGIYNSVCVPVGLSRCMALSDMRESNLNARQTENPDFDWVGFFTRVSRSRFLCGYNEKGWRADFEWLVKPNNFLKVNEGKYDNRGGVVSKPQTKQDRDDDAIIQSMRRSAARSGVPE